MQVCYPLSVHTGDSCTCLSSAKGDVLVVLFNSGGGFAGCSDTVSGGGGCDSALCTGPALPLPPLPVASIFFWGRPWWQWHPRRCLRCLALRHLLLWNNGTFWLHWLHWLHHWLISTGAGCRCILRRNQYGTALAQNPQAYSCVILTHEKTGNEKPSN